MDTEFTTQNGKGFGYCPVRGHALGWSGDGTYGDDDEGLVQSLHCCNCGADVEVYHCLPEDEKDYPYYNGVNNNTDGTSGADQ